LQRIKQRYYGAPAKGEKKLAGKKEKERHLFLDVHHKIFSYIFNHNPKNSCRSKWDLWWTENQFFCPFTEI